MLELIIIPQLIGCPSLSQLLKKKKVYCKAIYSWHSSFQLNLVLFSFFLLVLYNYMYGNNLKNLDFRFAVLEAMTFFGKTSLK